ncbi:MAG: response regulator [Elusimicrobiales bacterium]|nr:response regulator [Elusimicrobiales bacterium]
MADKVLVVDDDADNCSLLQFTLEQAGYQVVICPNGRNALDKVREEKPRAVILDVMLPGMDGVTIAKKMNDDDEMKKIPIIVSSSMDSSKGLFQGLFNVAKFLSKPFNPEDLLEELKNAIAGA